MSTIQSGSRRLSARLQQKEDNIYAANGSTNNGHASATATSTKAQPVAAPTKKRKKAYEEEDEGFRFSRVKSKKPRQSISAQPEPTGAQQLPVPVPEVQTTSPQRTKNGKDTANQQANGQHEDAEPPAPKRRKKMSFSTPGTKDSQQVRRSKRLSTEGQERRGSPVGKDVQELRPPKIRKENIEKHKPPAKLPTASNEEQEVQAAQESLSVPVALHEDHSSTKISLPFADTPVISRNKAMREGKSGKSDRRSSLGLRGRRASSLIDTGTSNALPHDEVEARNFYKHIGCDLLEPRRMKQLLTWCATRAMHPKPQGLSSEEASARHAARVIEEELLKDLANKSDLSDWFGREDAPAPAVPLPERPNPKNASNVEKIAELEERVERLRLERDALKALSQPSSIAISSIPGTNSRSKFDDQVLSESDASILNSLHSTSITTADISTRVKKVIGQLGPAIDTFADGVHKTNQFRLKADGMADQLLSICAGKIADREKAGRRKALGIVDDRSPGRDLTSVLRGLSKAER